MTSTASGDSAHITLRQRSLGSKLQELRERRGLSLQEAAAGLDHKGTTGLSKIETGRRSPTHHLLTDMINLYDVSDVDRRDLMIYYEEVTHRGWWDGYEGLRAATKELPWIERQAAAEQVSSPSVVWGLLQTESYARVVIQEVEPTTDKDAEESLRFRRTRQDILKGPNPPTLQVVLGEGVLVRDIGGPAVMAEQLEHLLHAVEELPLTLQVMPFAAGLRGPLGQYAVIQMRPPYPEVAYAEGAGGITILEGAQATHLAAAWQRLSEAALSPAESIVRIKAAIQNWRT